MNSGNAPDSHLVAEKARHKIRELTSLDDAGVGDHYVAKASTALLPTFKMGVTDATKMTPAKQGLEIEDANGAGFRGQRKEFDDLGSNPSKSFTKTPKNENAPFVSSASSIRSTKVAGNTDSEPIRGGRESSSKRSTETRDKPPVLPYLASINNRNRLKHPIDRTIAQTARNIESVTQPEQTQQRKHQHKQEYFAQMKSLKHLTSVEVTCTLGFILLLAAASRAIMYSNHFQQQEIVLREALGNGKDQSNDHYKAEYGNVNAKDYTGISCCTNPVESIENEMTETIDADADWAMTYFKFATAENLRHAVKQGDIEVLSLMIRQKPALINKPDANGWCAIHEAVRTGNEVTLQLLADAGCDMNIKTGPNQDHQNPLDLAIAIHGEHHPFTNYLRALVGQSNDHYKAEYDNTGTSSCANPVESIENEMTETIDADADWAMTYFKFATAENLRHAVKQGDIEVLSLMIRQKPALINKPDANGWCAIHEAVRTGNEVTLQLLADAGCDMNIKTGPNQDHQNPLDLAIAIHGEHHPFTNYLRALVGQSNDHYKAEYDNTGTSSCANPVESIDNEKTRL